jgi:hypothetical protein
MESQRSLAGKYVELYDYFDKPLEVRWNGVSLPYRVFGKDQRVNHIAIVENKRLGNALAGSVANFRVERRGPNAVVLRRSGSLLLSASLRAAMLSASAETPTPNAWSTNARFAANIAREVKSRGLSFA